MLRLHAWLLVSALSGFAYAQDPPDIKDNIGSRLVISSFNLDVSTVELLLKQGADPDSRLGFYDAKLFRNRRTGALSALGSGRWTPLLAVANGHRVSQPKVVSERDKRRIKIARMLINAKADLDLDDGYGATALSSAVYLGFDDLALLLISSGANLDTKTGVYIDGSGGIAPVHRATKSPRVLAALIKAGANVKVKDDTDDTPLHWAVRSRKVESVKLLLAAGADANAKDEEGRLPSFWCKTSERFHFPGDDEKREIAKLLEAATNSSRDRTKR